MQLLEKIIAKNYKVLLVGVQTPDLTPTINLKKPFSKAIFMSEK